MHKFHDLVFDTPKLGVFYLGGKIERSHIEIHDVVFVAGNSGADMSEQIKKQWIGTPNSLHIDSWFIAESIDGFNIHLSECKPCSHNKANSLFFVNLGSYKNGIFGELHFMTLVVAESRSKAIEKAKMRAPKNEDMQHCDNIYDLDECIRIDVINNYYITVEYTGIEQQSTIINGYQKLNN